ncbi:MAG: DUF302 domain-containing protein [Cyclobacteriaceae bacterium]
MAYHYSRKFNLPFDEVLSRISENLHQQGFAVITCIDVQDTLKQKLDIDFRKYKILGAFHPEFAYKAISLESHIGLIFPCHIVVQEHENREVEVSAISPLETIDKTMSTAMLTDLATHVDNRLRVAVDNLHRLVTAPNHAEALPTERAPENSPTLQG